MRAASLDTVDDKGIDCSFRKGIWEFSREVWQRPVCSVGFRVVSFRGFTVWMVAGRVFLER